MKKIFFTILTTYSVTSLSIYCQNNLNDATQSIIDNITQLKEKIRPENHSFPTYLTLNDIEQILIAQLFIKNSTPIPNAQRSKNGYEKLELIIMWLEKEKTVDDWINYFAIHNQVLFAIKNELKAEQNNLQIYNQLSQRILSLFKQAVQKFYKENKQPNDMISLVYVYQDYEQLFQEIINKSL
ncbi:hypothetical protein HYV10_02570 [Candidatus Dependentiae bacterium]|nr:hypothetical protein [Candidatus Dependentiae bacterium]